MTAPAMATHGVKPCMNPQSSAHISVKMQTDLLLFSVLYILISAQTPVHHWPDTCLTIKLPSMATNMNTFVIVGAGAGRELGFHAKKTKQLSNYT